MEESAHYYIEFGPLRQFVSEMSRLMAALLPVTRVGAYRLKKRLYAPLMVTVFVRHRSALPTEEALYELVEALRPPGFTVRFRISRYSGSLRWSGKIGENWVLTSQTHGKSSSDKTAAL